MNLLTPLDRSSEYIRVLTIVIAELELGNIERHVFAAHFMERSNYTAFEDRPEALNGLSMYRTDDILPLGMINGSVREVFIKPPVPGPLIGAKQADFMRDGFANESVKRCGLDVRDHAGHDVSFAANRTNDWCFAGTDTARAASAAAFIPMSIFGQATNESFIDFDDTPEFLDVLHKGNADFVTHFPCSFVRAKPHVPHNLKRAHTLLAGQHEMDNAIPITERLIGVLENRSSDVGKSIARVWRALVALPAPRTVRVFVRVLCAATRATNAIRPPARDKISAARVFVREHFLISATLI